MSSVEGDLLIIGAGPVGLYAAYYAGFRGLSTVVVDSLPRRTAVQGSPDLLSDLA
ncbi:MAG TPA: FAD-binding protein [Streptosporangiaceae bacterium]|jgi:thioredoxin reductase|nr:FAD-binding protein [Streptosporangiaceae bacterium]